MLLDIRDVKVGTTSFFTELEGRLSNWDKLHSWLMPTLKKEQDDGERIGLVLSLLAVELKTRKRLFVATRLLGIYHRLSRREDQRRLSEWLQ
jgi:hypothetical protein